MMKGGFQPSFFYFQTGRFSQMNIFLVDGMSAVYFGFDGDFRVLRKNDNSDIMTRQ